MTGWTSDELDEIGETEELGLASVRRDGTLRPPVTMWVVRDGDDIYVRSVKGRGSRWFRGARARHEARISPGGIHENVDLMETDDRGDALDTAYQATYGRRFPTIAASTVTSNARAATLKLVPSRAI